MMRIKPIERKSGRGRERVGGECFAWYLSPSEDYLRRGTSSEQGRDWRYSHVEEDPTERSDGGGIRSLYTVYVIATSCAHILCQDSLLGLAKLVRTMIRVGRAAVVHTRRKDFCRP